jgi:A/G-specific adenine glycosylase
MKNRPPVNRIDVPEATCVQFRDSLLEWYDDHARSLPWRGSGDPYLIWLSEIIFQQTRIEQGMGYYLRFTERFPNIRLLSSASEDEVLRLWQGLGYYSRARNLLSAARYIVKDLNGQFPQDYTGILKLKGVGDYSASCIASISFGQVHAAIDGNVFRVLARFFADPVPIGSDAARVHFKELASQLIAHDRPGDFNEAMMDLGALVCKPRHPLCHQCPLNRMCASFGRGVQEMFPVKAPSAKRRVVVMNYLLARIGSNILIRKRVGRDIWQGLYELPMVSGELPLAELAASYRKDFGLIPGSLVQVLRTQHLLSHMELDIRFYEAECRMCPDPVKPDLVSVRPDRVNEYPFPKPLADFIAGRI